LSAFWHISLKTQSSFLGFVLLFTFAMGFGVLFIILGTFSQLAGKLPRSGAWMNTVKTLLALALFAMSFFYAWPLIKRQLPIAQKEAYSENQVQWQAFAPSLVEKAKSESKPVIIDFYADWCAACLEMEEFTFSKKEVIQFSKQFVMLKVDGTKPSDELNEWNKTYKVFGYPTMIFISADGEVREDLTLTGFEKAAEFKQRMEKLINL
jgi:thiol:disulfide interchange protein DsbD